MAAHCSSGARDPCGAVLKYLLDQVVQKHHSCIAGNFTDITSNKSGNDDVNCLSIIPYKPKPLINSVNGPVWIYNLPQGFLRASSIICMPKKHALPETRLFFNIYQYFNQWFQGELKSEN